MVFFSFISYLQICFCLFHRPQLASMLIGSLAGPLVIPKGRYSEGPLFRNKRKDFYPEGALFRIGSKGYNSEGALFRNKHKERYSELII